MERSIETCKVSNYVAVDKLQFHAKNPRTIQSDRLLDLKTSIIEKGFYEPILVWNKGNIVLSGNHRLRAALELIDEGYKFKSGKKVNQLPVVYEDCDEETAEAILYESNNHYAEWIEDRLKEALVEADAAGQDLKAFGYSADEIDGYLANAQKEAEIIVAEHTRKVSEDDEKKEKPKIDEKYTALTLPVSLSNRFTSILKDISVQLDPEFQDDDSLDPALDALCRYIHKYGVPDVAEFID